MSAPAPGGDGEDFEIPLRRPYGPLFALAATMAPLGLFALVAPARVVPLVAWRAAAVVLLALSGAFALALFSLARHAQFSLRATMANLQIPRRPTFSTAPRAIPWREISLIRLENKRALVIETRSGRFTIPPHWLGNAATAALAARVLDERLQLTARKQGAALAQK